MSVAYVAGLELARVSLREDAKRITPQDWILIAEQATLHFSKDKPREIVADVTGNNTNTYTLTSIITGWTNRFSYIKNVEFPIGDDPTTYIQSDKLKIYKSATDTEQLKFSEFSPASTTSFRISYTGLHTFTTATSTIDDLDKSVFCLLLAHYAAMALVSDFLKANRSNLPNDSVDFSQKSRDMQSLADVLLKKYSDLITGKTDSVKSYTTVLKDFDMTSRYKTRYFTVPEDSR